MGLSQLTQRIAKGLHALAGQTGGGLLDLDYPASLIEDLHRQKSQESKKKKSYGTTHSSRELGTYS